MLGKKIKEIIEGSEYGQSEIAGKLGISVPTLRRIYGRDSVELDILLRFCKIYDLKPSFFVSDLEGIEVPTERKITEDTETNWKEKYFQSQKEVSSLKNELKEVRDRLDKLTDALALKFLGVELGKDKASSISQATLSKEELMYKLNFSSQR